MGVHTGIGPGRAQHVHLLTHHLVHRRFEFALDGPQRFRVGGVLLLPAVEVRALVGDRELVARHDVGTDQCPKRSPGANMPSFSK